MHGAGCSHVTKPPENPGRFRALQFPGYTSPWSLGLPDANRDVQCDVAAAVGDGDARISVYQLFDGVEYYSVREMRVHVVPPAGSDVGSQSGVRVPHRQLRSWWVPSNGGIGIRAAGVIGEEVRVRIVDAGGRIVADRVFGPVVNGSFTTTIPLSRRTSGVYFVTCRDARGSVDSRCVVVE